MPATRSRAATHKDAAAASAVLNRSAKAKAKADELLKVQEEQGTEAAQAAFVQTVTDTLAPKTTRRRRSSSVPSLQKASRTRANAKTGDPQADRAARDAASLPTGYEGKATGQTLPTGNEKATPTATHVFMLVNGDFRVHAAGCKDVPKDLAKSDYSKAAEATWANEDEAVRELWSDQIAESDDPTDLSSYFGATEFLPCCKLTATADKAKAAKRDAKQALAKAVLDAVGDLFAADAPITKRLAVEGMDEETAKRTVAQWLHHLNAGQVDGQRYFPESLPRPNRSDWR
jgi:phenylpyruvate tautomerase PptA (4-oxalocrotonate tautomerase family)